MRVELLVGNDITGTLTDFLSDIPPGQNKTAIFTLTIDPSMPVASYSVGLRFDWTQDNNQYALDHTYLITLNIQGGGYTTYAPISVAVIAVVACGYFLRKKIFGQKKQLPPPLLNRLPLRLLLNRQMSYAVIGLEQKQAWVIDGSW